jgi:iron complex outermembrane receptor protein
MKFKVKNLSWAVMVAVTPLSLGLSSSSYGEALVLEEIMVTAQKRAENVNDVPIAIQAFSEEILKNAGVARIEDLALVTPGLVMSKMLMSNAVYIRGVGSPAQGVGTEAPVATYLDGVYLPSSHSSFGSFNSVERVEVLKGPQGTLFGRNATGGLIHIISKDPVHDSHVKGSLSYGDYDTYGAKLYATTGLSENVAADVALLYNDQDEGYGTNLTSGKDTNRKDEVGVRTKWLFTPNEDTEIRFIADYADVETSLGVIQAVLPGSIAVDGTQAPADFYDSLQNPDGVYVSDTWGTSLRIDHTFGDLEFTSITSYREVTVEGHFEQLTSPLGAVKIDIKDINSDTFSHEFQLQQQGDKLGWIAGLYYLNIEEGYYGPDALQVSGLFVPAQQNIFFSRELESLAAYAEANYMLTDKTRLTAGIRWTRDEQDIVHDIFVNRAPYLTIPQSAKHIEPTWRIVLDHTLNDDNFMYASYSRGFKSGTFNSSGPGAPPTNPEIIDAYEIGLKSTLLDGAGQMNIALYYNDYADLQVTRTVQGSLVTENAAQAEILGLEVDFVANLTEQLQLRAGLAVTDSEYSDFPTAPISTPTGVGGNSIAPGDVSGNSLARVPDYTYNIGGVYSIPIESGNIDLGINYLYNDGFAWQPGARTVQDSYGLVSAFVSWTSSDENWGLRLFGDNLTDEEYYLFVTEQSVADVYAPAPPRTFGVEVHFEF